nr:MAG TPA: hypothetical protein [Caudoviricetes sp.]
MRFFRICIEKCECTDGRRIIARRRYLEVYLFGRWFELFKKIGKCRGCNLLL